METIELTIYKGQNLKDIYPVIESNVILNKTLSGIGATYSEIKTPRNSIIVVPNLPVIICKVTKHKKENLLGVYQKIGIDEIIEYLDVTKAKKKWIKIMVTPESFYKVKKAFAERKEFDMHNNCFLLLDEAHKFIKDKDFRPEITEPLNEFFQFKEKALVSATALIPSDPRFHENHFKIIKIKPDYNYLQPIQLTETNNILEAFKDFLKYLDSPENKEVETICFFINSVDMIQQFIEKAGINNESAVFCSEKSTGKLKFEGIKNVHNEWNLKYKKRFMFFTSRFYNGLDIELETKPFVVFISDPYHKDFSVVDPSTDMPQAIGRFRNGVFKVEHIVAFNSNIEVRTKESSLRYLETVEKIYSNLRTAYFESQDIEEKSAYITFVNHMPFKDFFIDGTRDYFVWDNCINNELVKSAYKNLDLLTQRYSLSNYFRNPLVLPLFYPLGEKERLALYSSRKFKKQQRIEIVNQLEALKGSSGTEIGNRHIRELREWDNLIVDAYFKLGKDIIEENNYNSKKLQELLIDKNYKDDTRQETFIRAIFNSFRPGQKYKCDYIKKELKRIHDKYAVKAPWGITAQSIHYFFEINNKVRIGNDKAILIGKPKIESYTYFFDKALNIENDK